MVYKRMVEIGRIVFIGQGKDEGKLAVIVDVVDGNRALIDGPSSGVRRGVRNFKDLQLTKFKIPLRHGMRTRNVLKAYDEAKINEKFAESLWAKKLQRKALREKMTDFDRFKLMKAKQRRNRIIAIEFGKLRKVAAGRVSKPKAKGAK
uniref:Large ribosomal subunit protein eL14 n=1 Tax=Syphacia muris TaxID=451379 RepID=A0A0N5A8A5_9BILA